MAPASQKEHTATAKHARYKDSQVLGALFLPTLPSRRRPSSLIYLFFKKMKSTYMKYRASNILKTFSLNIIEKPTPDI